MYSDEDFIQLSALQHFIFCRRQCALIHLEQVWIENLFTAEGRVMHDNVHEEKYQKRSGVRMEHGVSLYSMRLGLSGKADVVEFHKKGDVWVPFPVEYKRGKPKRDDSDKVQLCAQALCLEEMLDIEIEKGAIFYGKTRHRLEVIFSRHLRDITIDAIRCVHELMQAGKTPPAVYEKRCEKCSLLDLCMPKILVDNGVSDYFEKVLIG
ncbi:MAG: CRISPR-associated protein Cas4 [Candidatus Omnitrophota bacterium]